MTPKATENSSRTSSHDQCMKVKSESEVGQSCPTLCDPVDCSHQAPLSMGFSRQVLEWGAIAFSETDHMALQRGA